MKYFQFLLSLLITITTIGCDQIPCEDVDCGEHGTCVETDGTCSCDSGFSLNVSTGLCSCPENSTYSDSAQLCLCADGYGPGNLSPCEAFNLKFIGIWTGSHTDISNNQVTGPYTMSLSAMLEPNEVLFQNFMNLFCQGPQLAVDADGTVVTPGQSGGEFASPCIEWVFSNGSFELVSSDSLIVSVSVTPGLGGPSMSFTGSYTR